MKKNHFLVASLLLLSMFYCNNSFGQYGTIKFCPNTIAWKKNLELVSNEKGMFENYAKGPDGCWWLKSANHASYKEGFYQFSIKGLKYYYNSKKKIWEDGNRKMCLAKSPFGN